MSELSCVWFTPRNIEETHVGETVADTAGYEFKCENLVTGCTTVLSAESAQATESLAQEHVTIHHPTEKITAETISDNIEPILVR